MFDKVSKSLQIPAGVLSVNIQDYLQVKEAAQFLGISPSTLRNWERNGKITTHRHLVNHYRLYKKADLEALLIALENSATEREIVTGGSAVV